MTKYDEMIKVWKSNATYEGLDIPVTLLKAQLLDAANVVEILDKELNRIKKGVRDIATGKYDDKKDT